MFDRSNHRLSSALSRALLKTVPLDDVWSRRTFDVPTKIYGLGSRHDFSWYLDGVGNVSISSIDEILNWLGDCSYIRDPELFHEKDYWQHPCTFERLRAGDCEDFALWTWRQLIQLGLRAEFVAGRCHCHNPDDAPGEEWLTGHTWVHFENNGESMLFDSVAALRDGRESGNTIRPIGEARGDYLPEVSVDENLVRYVYGGYFRTAGLDRDAG